MRYDKVVKTRNISKFDLHLHEMNFPQN